MEFAEPVAGGEIKARLPFGMGHRAADRRDGQRLVGMHVPLSLVASARTQALISVDGRRAPL